MQDLLICFDVDGTLIDDTVFIWETLHDRFQTDTTMRKHWSNAYWNGDITYAEWATKDVEMWIEKKVNRELLKQAIDDLHPMKGAIETLQTLRNETHTLGVISGSLDIALEMAFKEYSNYFEEVLLNRLIFDVNDQLIGVVPTPYDIEHKATGLIEMAKKTGYSLDRTVFIGDNFNDVDVAEIAGYSIAFNCKSKELAEVSDAVVKGNDLRAIIPLIKKFQVKLH